MKENHISQPFTFIDGVSILSGSRKLEVKEDKQNTGKSEYQISL